MKKNRNAQRSAPQVMDSLLFLIDQSYSRKAWHGTNLRGSIRGLSAKEAGWKPSRNRHSIWEIVVHCAYWKYIVRRRIQGEKRGSFPLKGSNWFTRRHGLSEQDWQQDLGLLESCHTTMRDAIARLKPGDLPANPRGSTVSNVAMIVGIASHDVYHAGQIQLLKRLYRKRAN